MAQETKTLKKELGPYKVLGFTNVVLAIVIWLGTVYLWGMLDPARVSLPWNIVVGSLVIFILLGVFLLVNGILILRLTGSAAKVVSQTGPDSER